VEPNVVEPLPIEYPVPATGVPQLRIVQPELVVHAVLAWHVTEEAVPE